MVCNIPGIIVNKNPGFSFPGASELLISAVRLSVYGLQGKDHEFKDNIIFLPRQLLCMLVTSEQRRRDSIRECLALKSCVIQIVKMFAIITYYFLADHFCLLGNFAA